MKIKLLLTAVGALCVLALIIWGGWEVTLEAEKNTGPEMYATTTVQTGELSYSAEIADTDTLRILGLSGRKSLAQGAALLFIFPKDDFYGFWMKDMLFSIDIIGLDGKKRVVWLEENMKPSSFPHVFTPPRPVRFVLEVPAGSIKKDAISLGQEFSW